MSVVRMLLLGVLLTACSRLDEPGTNAYPALPPAGPPPPCPRLCAAQRDAGCNVDQDGCERACVERLVRRPECEPIAEAFVACRSTEAAVSCAPADALTPGCASQFAVLQECHARGSPSPDCNTATGDCPRCCAVLFKSAAQAYEAHLTQCICGICGASGQCDLLCAVAVDLTVSQACRDCLGSAARHGTDCKAAAQAACAREGTCSDYLNCVAQCPAP